MPIKSLALLFLPMCILAQCLPFQDGATISGNLHGVRAGEDSSADRTSPDAGDRFRFERYDPTGQQSRERDRLDSLPVEPSEPKPISGFVSLRQLQHPPSKKAVRLFREALRYSQAHDTEKAIGKLQEAIRIEPLFQEAHQNLGVQYARSERTAEAMTQFQTALEIGPPDAKAYANLGWCYARLKQFREAE